MKDAAAELGATPAELRKLLGSSRD
jgi:hypothetical protein